MIITNIKAGLGNQLFQYALGRKLALKNNETLKLDISGYPKQTLRKYGLSVFNIEENIADDQEVKRLKYPLGILSMVWRRFSFKILRRHHVGWEPNTLKSLEKKKNFYLDGFWQSYKYFDDVADTIRRDFTLKEPLEKISPELNEKIKGTNSISLHIRRSDYLNPKVQKQFGSCSLNYYAQAIKIISGKIPDPVFFVFSDDPTWVKENLKLEFPMVAVSDYQLKDFQEMTAMSLCKHNIIANSSFSWWGAWMNANPDKIVISPDKWFNDGSLNIDDLIPASWTRIPRDQ